MSTIQQGILSPLPPANRYLSFQIADPDGVARALAALRDATDAARTVVGVGPSLVQALDRKIDGLKPFPDLSKPGAPVPSTQVALWVWLRGDDHGEITLRSRAIEACWRRPSCSTAPPTRSAMPTIAICPATRTAPKTRRATRRWKRRS